MAQSTERYRLNTYTHIKIINVVKKKREKKMFIYQHSWTTLYRHRQPYIYIHTHTRTHPHKCAHTNAIRVGAKDNNTQLPLGGDLTIYISWHRANDLVRRFINIHSHYITFTLHKSSKTRKRLKERFSIGRNMTKRAHFRGSPLFEATYDTET